MSTRSAAWAAGSVLAVTAYEYGLLALLLGRNLPGGDHHHDRERTPSTAP